MPIFGDRGQCLETVAHMVPSATAEILLGGEKIYERSKYGKLYHSLRLWTALKTSFEKVAAVAGLRSSVKLSALQAYGKCVKLTANLQHVPSLTSEAMVPLAALLS